MPETACGSEITCITSATLRALRHRWALAGRSKSEMVRPAHHPEQSRRTNSNIEFSNDPNKPIGTKPKFFCLGHLNFGHFILFRVSDFVLRIYSRVIGKGKAKNF
jgi:hypothetical protein